MKNEPLGRGEEMAQFQKQFDEKQWKRLTSNPEFAAAWATENVVRAGEIANQLLYGNYHSADTAKKLRHYE
jgi:hypothetical protein